MCQCILYLCVSVCLCICMHSCFVCLHAFMFMCGLAPFIHVHVWACTFYSCSCVGLHLLFMFMCGLAPFIHVHVWACTFYSCSCVGLHLLFMFMCGLAPFHCHGCVCGCAECNFNVASMLRQSTFLTQLLEKLDSEPEKVRHRPSCMTVHPYVSVQSVP